MNTIQKRENMAEISNLAQTKNGAVEWVIRLLKGVLVGIGFITPGLSGGVLAVVFGLYEPLMRFLGDIRVKFLQNVRYFLPVGLGLGMGVIGFSSVVDYAFSNFAAQFTWLFIGFICLNWFYNFLWLIYRGLPLITTCPPPLAANS